MIIFFISCDLELVHLTHYSWSMTRWWGGGLWELHQRPWGCRQSVACGTQTNSVGSTTFMIKLLIQNRSVFCVYGSDISIGSFLHFACTSWNVFKNRVSVKVWLNMVCMCDGLCRLCSIESWRDSLWPLVSSTWSDQLWRRQFVQCLLFTILAVTGDLAWFLAWFKKKKKIYILYLFEDKPQ